MALNMAPPYYFTVKEMRKRPGSSPRVSSRGWPLPPKALGNNIVDEVTHFQHNGQATDTLPAIPRNAQAYSTYSMYVYNATVWTVKYDATIFQVHDGRDTSASSGNTSEDSDEDVELPDEAIEADEEDEDEDEDDDWISMSFNYRANSVSYVGRRNENWRLCTQRQNQPWARHILTDTYMAQRRSQNANHGGLIGDLPLLIGLIALSVSEDRVSTVLPQVMQRSWRFNLSNPLSRGDGWWDGRGLVVTTYASPPHSHIEDLENYEDGHYGNILD